MHVRQNLHNQDTIKSMNIKISTILNFASLHITLIQCSVN